MKEKILDIITECKLGEITTDEATRQVFDLFGISGLLPEEEYIIISRTAIEKRIEQLEDLRKNSSSDNNDYYQGQIKSLEQILSHSTPLLPELGKAYEAGKLDKELSMSFDNPKARYLSNYTIEV